MVLKGLARHWHRERSGGPGLATQTPHRETINTQAEAFKNANCRLRGAMAWERPNCFPPRRRPAFQGFRQQREGSRFYSLKKRIPCKNAPMSSRFNKFAFIRSGAEHGSLSLSFPIFFLSAFLQR